MYLKGKNDMGTVLIAGRGEMAVRIIHTCKKVGLETVSVYAEGDENSLHVRLADHSVCIGPRAAHKSYLNIPSMLAVATAYDVDMIHPGIGFLSENAAFAQACEEAGIAFAGPSAQTMRILGDKQAARALFKQKGFPVMAGSDSVPKDREEALEQAEAIGFPLMIKAAMGGGGKGIRIVQDTDAFLREYPLAYNEAKQAFGDGSVYLERYLPRARHIEVQILCDAHGNALHLGTRECSLQRKNQKLIEEAPAPFVDAAVIERMQQTAIAMARCVGYRNAGTVEFLLDDDNNFYFMEMNARLQVEHGVSECIYDVDIVKAQLHIALGHRLCVEQKDLISRGHAIECRINAEDATENFRPSPGLIENMVLPFGIGVRVDTGYVAGDRISPFYDSLILKLICRGEDRDEALALCRVSLDMLRIDGVCHNAAFARAMLSDADCIAGQIHTKWIEHDFISRFVREML